MTVNWNELIRPAEVRQEDGKKMNDASTLNSDEDCILLLIKAILYEDRILFKSLPVGRHAVEKVQDYLREKKGHNVIVSL